MDDGGTATRRTEERRDTCSTKEARSGHRLHRRNTAGVKNKPLHDAVGQDSHRVRKTCCLGEKNEKKKRIKKKIQKKKKKREKETKKAKKANVRRPNRNKPDPVNFPPPFSGREVRQTGNCLPFICPTARRGGRRRRGTCAGQKKKKKEGNISGDAPIDASPLSFPFPWLAGWLAGTASPLSGPKAGRASSAQRLVKIATGRDRGRRGPVTHGHRLEGGRPSCRGTAHKSRAGQSTRQVWRTGQTGRTDRRRCCSPTQRAPDQTAAAREISTFLHRSTRHRQKHGPPSVSAQESGVLDTSQRQHSTVQHSTRSVRLPASETEKEQERKKAREESKRKHTQSGVHPVHTSSHG